jgi:hypothetical protein
MYVQQAPCKGRTGCGLHQGDDPKSSVHATAAGAFFEVSQNMTAMSVDGVLQSNTV